MDTFEDFANSTIKASAILTEEEIQKCLKDKDTKRLWEYAYRIAGFVTVYVRGKIPVDTDEGDLQDAVQQCMVAFPDLLQRYEPPKMPYLRYFSQHFQRIIVRYLNTLANGGMGSYDTDAEQVRHVEWAEVTDEEAIQEIDGVESVAFGTRDPMKELMAQQDAEYAVAYAREWGKHVVGPWDEPELDAANQADVRRIRKNRASRY
jgi:hypothetical protein